MSKTFRDGRVWPLQLVLAGLIVWLAQGILIQKGEVSEVAYAAQGQADRRPVLIERSPLRFIKDPNPSLSLNASFREPTPKPR